MNGPNDYVPDWSEDRITEEYLCCDEEAQDFTDDLIDEYLIDR